MRKWTRVWMWISRTEEYQSPENGFDMRGRGQVRLNRRVPILRYFRHIEYSIGSIASTQYLQRRASVDTRADANFEGSRAVSAVQFDSEVGWDGNSLTVWATVNGSRVFCEIPRSTIHGVPLLSDEISWEISRNRAAIFDRLRTAVVAKIVRSRDKSIRLHSSDVSAPALELVVG
jgi:hypothetical protein